MSRRTLTLRPLGQAILCLLCVGAGIGLSVLWPWGFALPPEPAVPQRPPTVGEVLCDPAGTCAFVLAVDTLPDGDRLAAVAWIRGRTGREALRIVGCDAGEGVVVALHDARQRQRWSRGGDSVHDLIAQAACGPARAA